MYFVIKNFMVVLCKKNKGMHDGIVLVSHVAAHYVNIIVDT